MHDVWTASSDNETQYVARNRGTERGHRVGSLSLRLEHEVRSLKSPSFHKYMSSRQGVVGGGSGRHAYLPTHHDGKPYLLQKCELEASGVEHASRRDEL